MVREYLKCMSSRVISRHFVILCIQSRPHLSEVTPWQVLVGRYPWETFLSDPLDNDCWKKSAFEAMLYSVENGGEDPIIFIWDKIFGKHISGNHRWFIKERYRLETRKSSKTPILASYTNPSICWFETWSSEVSIYFVDKILHIHY